jgi:hypothetical protein
MADGTPIAAMLMHLMTQGQGIPQGYRAPPMPPPRPPEYGGTVEQDGQQVQPWVAQHQQDIDNRFWSKERGGTK